VLVDLVQTMTSDGIRLDGTFQSPRGAVPTALGIDGVCLVHGTGSNFYSSTLFDSLGERFLELGCAVLRINTRGHDGISTAHTAQGGKRLGAAFEIVDDCRHDLAAWVDWLRQRAGARVGLVGHSLGAVKCLYAVGHEQLMKPSCIVAISPPRLSYSWFCTSPEGPQFLETYALAERYLQAGQPLALLEVKLPLPFAIAAAGYAEKYGPDERYNFLKFIGSIHCPLLLTLGGIEVRNNMAFRGLAEALADLGQGNLEVETIAGADHFYTGLRGELVGQLESWLQSLSV
jgi:pimeloyl-ACP methyl ester carboxylesterase